jgi:hypothetical protein
MEEKKLSRKGKEKFPMCGEEENLICTEYFETCHGVKFVLRMNEEGRVKR